MVKYDFVLKQNVIHKTYTDLQISTFGCITSHIHIIMDTDYLFLP